MRVKIIALFRCSKPSSKNGQTAVEFILLMAAVVGIVTAANTVLAPRLEEALGELVMLIREQGWVGGYEVQNAEEPLVTNYDPSSACMATTEASGCQ